MYEAYAARQRVLLVSFEQRWRTPEQSDKYYSNLSHMEDRLIVTARELAFLKMLGYTETTIDRSEGALVLDPSQTAGPPISLEMALDRLPIWGLGTAHRGRSPDANAKDSDSTGYRRTHGIVTDSESSNPNIEADVIMTAAVLGLAVSQITSGLPIRFDIDPRWKEDEESFKAVIGQLDTAAEGYLSRKNLLPAATISAGFAPRHTKGAVIAGVYRMAGQEPPSSVNEPALSPKGKELYEKIRNEEVQQYLGRGAYTGFVENRNTMENTDPFGPLSTTRFLVPDPDTLHETSMPHPRWLPSDQSPLWGPRLRWEQHSDMPWGIIGGDKARELPKPHSMTAWNEADQITALMKAQGMVFEGESPLSDRIAGYTHGMIQAIYKAYALGPNATPYEITVGAETTKLASCLPCSLFMIALGYPPTSIHLGRGESWVPLYGPYNPGRSSEPAEQAVIRDLNTSWQEKCAKWLALGLDVLEQEGVTADHQESVTAVRNYLDRNSEDKSVASVLILDAVTIHENETDRIARTLKPQPNG
ncbi:hypothetical protein [Streptomyces sp. NPDC058579]|uniref:hypothetical protein n=1 Tax=Streptomyces sp. NPDC058579 TaxID=3346548 RepID=UPI00365ADE6F